VLAHVTATVVDLTRHEKEKSFPTAPDWKELLPSIHDPASKELSVIVPAYNEELRSESSHDHHVTIASIFILFCIGSI
jgi:cellulose synthase/poly-beta-1,6-N-acetylglucosamine synthase-like glycosyltransferase